MIRPYNPEQDNPFFSQSIPPYQQAWVVCDPDPIGWLAIASVPGLEHLLDGAIYVHHEHRQKGYGSRLLSWLHEQEIKYDEISFGYDSADLPSTRFFAKHGYTADHTEQTYRLPIPPTGTMNHVQIYPPHQQAALLQKMYDDAFANEAWYQPFSTVKEVTDWLKFGSIVLYEIDGQPVGFAGIRPIANALEIEPFGIVSDYQGQGHGRQFLQELLAHLAPHKQPIQIGVWQQNERAVRLYRSAGFHLISQLIYVVKPL